MAATGSALGQPAVSDPTRPPALLSATAAAKAGVQTFGLQTVILRQGRKPVAIINGTMVELGGRIGDARLVKLSESQAVLQGPNGREIVHLMPAAEKTARPAAPEPMKVLR